MAHSSCYLIEGTQVPSVTTVLSIIHKPALVKWQIYMGSKAEAIREEAATFGSAVHDAIEARYTADEKPNGLPWRVTKSLETFEAWVDRHVDTFLVFEAAAYNPEHMYAGTWDCIAKMKDGRVAMLDFKTSKTTHQEYEYQVAAYAKCHYHDKPGVLLQEVEDYYIVHLDHKTLTWKHHKVEDIEGNFKVFLAALTLYKEYNPQFKHDGTTSQENN